MKATELGRGASQSAAAGGLQQVEDLLIGQAGLPMMRLTMCFGSRSVRGGAP